MFRYLEGKKKLYCNISRDFAVEYSSFMLHCLKKMQFNSEANHDNTESLFPQDQTFWSGEYLKHVSVCRCRPSKTVKKHAPFNELTT